MNLMSAGCYSDQMIYAVLQQTSAKQDLLISEVASCIVLTRDSQILGERLNNC